MSKYNYRRDNCKRCGNLRSIQYRGLCSNCVKRLTCDGYTIEADGTEVHWPRILRTRDEVLDLYVIHRNSMKTAEMAAVLGIKAKSFRTSLERARKAGDPRAKSIVEVTNGACFITRVRQSSDGRIG